jgi:hypothetical protein
MYRVQSRSNDGPDADLDWVRQSVGKLFCEHCRTVNRKLYPQPIDVVLRQIPPRTWTSGGCFRVGIPIYRADFAAIVQREVPEFIAGRCLLPDSSVVEDYVTLYSPTWLLMRGDEQTTTRVCQLCGSVWTDLVMVFPGRPAYLLRHQLTGASIYQGRSGPLFMVKELVDTIDWRQFSDMRRQRVDIRDTPLDGRRLPGDPDWDALSEK